MMIGGRVCRPSDIKRAYRAYEPDIDRAAEGLSRAAPAAVAGAADAGVRARHRTRGRRRRRHLRTRTIAQDRAWNGRGYTAANRRPGAAAISSARTLSHRGQPAYSTRPGPAGVAAVHLAVAGT